MKKVYFVRHGEAAGNSGGFTQVATTPLTEKGHEQAATVAGRFSSLPIEVVCASHMDRAQDTAGYIARATGLTVETLEHFHEFTKPTSVQGSTHDSEIYKQYQAAENAHYTDPEWRFEDGENFTDILARVSAGITELEQRPESHIVVVTHGRLLRFITSYLLHKKQLTADIEQRTSTSMQAINTGITLFEYSNDAWRLHTWNDIAHFAE